MSFDKAGEDTVALNETLGFAFSTNVDPASVNAVSIQIREGPEFGRVVPGAFEVRRHEVLFVPVLPVTCGMESASFRPGRTYRVTLGGYPTEYGVRSASGDELLETVTREFRTRGEEDPHLFLDQVPGERPQVLDSSPRSGATAVAMDATAELRVLLSENIDPCTLELGTTLRLAVHQRGDPTLFLETDEGTASGFDPAEDVVPDEAYRWSEGATTLAVPVEIPAELRLRQTQEGTELLVVPEGGRLPENTLVVLELTGQILDFGRNPLDPTAIAFTTENVPSNPSVSAIEYDGTEGIEGRWTTVDVDSDRSPSRAQAWLSFSGDGDAGEPPFTHPTFPTLDAGGEVLRAEPRPNDGLLDDLVVDGDVFLDTGSSLVPYDCTNESDGSTAVVWEFNRVQVTGTGRLHVVGVNPAIVLVRGDVLVESGGQILLRGQDGANSHDWNAVDSLARKGGRGVAGGGSGGGSSSAAQAMSGTLMSLDGVDGYGSPAHPLAGGHGGGRGGSNSVTSSSPCNLSKGAQGGGGGGHALEGGSALDVPPTGSTWYDASAGGGGFSYPTAYRLLVPSAGSGGGGGGSEGSSPGSDEASGGGGGAGGGFLGITAGGDIRIYGTIDASGGAGGRGGWDPDGTCNGANAGGGGGGAGGAVRLLTPARIDVTGGRLLAAGGAAGLPGGTRGGAAAGGGPFAGAGADGRIVLEDGDAVIQGLSAATVVPAEGDDGFYRGTFDSSRFVKGGTEGVATTEPIRLGTILDPSSVTFDELQPEDFLAGIPAEASRGLGEVGMIVEMRGFDARPDGTLDPDTAGGWFVIGHFLDSGVPTAPLWRPNEAPDAFEVDGAGGIGIQGLDGRMFVQVRTHFRMPTGMSAADPGPYVDRMRLRFTYDN